MSARMHTLDRNRAERPAPPNGRIAYIMSRFPKITETFILYEILALEAQGVAVEVFPLLRERQRLTHPEAAAVVERAHYQRFLSWKILFAHLWFLLRTPRLYLATLFEVLRGTLGSVNFFIGAIGILPKSVRFAYEMRKLGVTHVHAHFANHPAVAALIIHRLTGIPYSFTAHGSDLHVDRRMLERKVTAAAFAITISEYNKELMVRECGVASREKIHVVHCGVDPSVFVPRSNAGTSARLRILCVASFEEVKGHRYLLDACRILRERGHDFRCDFVGDGPRQREVEAQIQRDGLHESVIMHGPLLRSEVSTLMAECDIFCLPSVPTRQGKREGIPVVLMEAMASGVPVVSSRLSGIPELVEDGTCGILVEPRDSVGLANALERLERDAQLRRRMGQAGRARIESQFNLAVNAQRLAQLFATSQRGNGMTSSTPQPGVANHGGELVEDA
ncbi:MAG: glycosyltransferase family 4 protein [Candidatus Latescibacterota bacterium]|nr:MAG: glycosyltransferase family 4 protein [Candidatus Latescibacterota bacterium]